MRKASRWTTAALAVLAGLLLATQAYALGVGGIQVQSGLGQPFSATIPLHLNSPSDLDGLTVSLANAAAFRRAGIAPSEAVSGLQFQLQNTGNQAHIRVTGKRPIREPFLNFIVAVQWNGGTLLREYTVLLNPPSYGQHRAVSGVTTLASTSNVIGIKGSTAQSVAPVPELAPKGAPELALSPPMPSSEVQPATAPVTVALAKHPEQVRASGGSNAQAAPGSSVEPAEAVAPTHNSGKAGRGESSITSADSVHAEPVTSQPKDTRASQPASEGAPSTATTSSQPAASGAKDYGPVKAGQTFWSIAEKVRPTAAVTMNQVLLAIYNANPRAFSQQRFNGLMKGVMLKIPSAAVMRSVSGAEAKRQVAALRAALVQPQRASQPSAPTRLQTSSRRSATATAQPQSTSANQSQSMAGTAETAPAKSASPDQAAGAAVQGSGTEAAGPMAASSANTAAQSSGAETANSLNSETMPASVASVGAAAEASSRAVAATTSSPEVTDMTASTPAAAASASSTASAASTPTESGAAAASTNAALQSGSAAAAAASTQTHPQSTAVNAYAPVSASGPAQSSKGGGVLQLLAGLPAGLLSGVNWRIVGFLVLLVLLLLAWLSRRRRHQGDDDAQTPPPADGPQSFQTPPTTPAADAAIDSADGLNEDRVAGESEAAAPTTDGDGEPKFDLGATAGLAASAAVLAGGAGAASPFEPATQAEGGADPTAAAAPADTADILADAEFNLAYGLYGEAAAQFKQVIEREPERTDVKLRLAETWFEAGEGSRFELVAAELKPEVDAEQWRELAAKGRRLCPGSETFDDAPTRPAPDSGDRMESSEDAEAAPNKDWTQASDGEALLAAGMVADPAEPVLHPPAASDDASTPGENVIEFDPPSGNEQGPAEHAAPQQTTRSGSRPERQDAAISDEELGAFLAAAEAAQPSDPARQSETEQADADLGDAGPAFDLINFDADDAPTHGTWTPASADPPAGSEAVESHVADGHIDLGALDFDLGDEEQVGVRESSLLVEPAAVGQADSASGADAPDTADTADTSEAVAEADPVGATDGMVATSPASEATPQPTPEQPASDKLELAEIYASMGDNDAARDLLREVTEAGSAEEKAAAETMLKTLAD